MLVVEPYYHCDLIIIRVSQHLQYLSLVNAIKLLPLHARIGGSVSCSCRRIGNENNVAVIKIKEIRRQLWKLGLLDLRLLSQHSRGEAEEEVSQQSYTSMHLRAVSYD